MSLHDMKTFEEMVTAQVKAAQEPAKPLAAPAVKRNVPQPAPAPREHYCDCTSSRYDMITGGSRD
jgi:hypothetical protein